MNHCLPHIGTDKKKLSKQCTWWTNKVLPELITYKKLNDYPTKLIKKVDWKFWLEISSSQIAAWWFGVRLQNGIEEKTHKKLIDNIVSFVGSAGD